MAIAGGALPSVKLWIIDGKLHEGGAIARGHDVVERNPQRAIDRLLNGETINLELHGLNLSKVREALNENR